jgi:anti-anti-sigma factor
MTALPDIHTPEHCEQPRCSYLIDCAGAQLEVRARSLATVLRISGEIDASNADRVAEAVQRFSQLTSPLILDLSHLDFLGVAGFRALITLNREHQQAQLHSSVVKGAAMRPLTRVFPDHDLPIVDSVPEALQVIEKGILTRRQFLSGLSRSDR